MRSLAEPTPRVVVFDLDGTLIDTMSTFADVAADVMFRHHATSLEVARSRYLATSGVPFFRQLALIMPDHPSNAICAEEFERRKVAATANVRPSDASIRTIRQLKARGLGVAVSSNNSQTNVERSLRDLRADIDVILGFGSGSEKGESHFRTICDRFGCQVGELLFVGDSLHDAEVAVEVGARFVAKVGTFSAESFHGLDPELVCVDDLEELIALVFGRG